MKESLVIDLDKTLLKIDTFRSYMLYVGREALKVLRLDICFTLLLFMLLRKARWISHGTMKYHVLCKSQYFMEKAHLEAFAQEISGEVNEKVLHIIKEYQAKDYFVLLSTAAPVSYASKIKDIFGFDAVCATPMPQKHWEECVRENKCRTTLDLLEARGFSLDTFITDHSDDLPLLRIHKRQNLLVSPDAKTLQLVKQENIPFDILR